MSKTTPDTNTIPISLARLFQEYDFDSMNVITHSKIIIERTLELGTWEELHWLFHHYGLAPIIDYLKTYGDRRLSKVTFNYWRKLLGIKKFCRAPFAEIRDDIWRNS